MSGVRVLVLGAEGMLGQTVFRVLSRNDDIGVVGTSRRGSAALVPFEAEKDDVGELLGSLGGVDFIINAIAVLARDIRSGDTGSVERARFVNGVFPHRLCEAARRRGARVFLVSTDGVFGGDQGICLESTAPRASDAYGASKLQGEVRADHALNVRCSIVGPDPRRRRGLVEWVLGQPPGAGIRGFTDQRWNGVTTLQFARLCEGVITRDLFERFRAESPVHHFCPNGTVTKFQLLVHLRDCYRPDLSVTPEESGHPMRREFGTEMRSIPALMGAGLSLARALEELRDLEAAAPRARSVP